ncbi:MAG: flagellar biosynthetic protein FliR [Candidatus Eisenbacteria bacterium]
MTPDALNQALTPDRWPALIYVTARVTGLMLSAPLWSMAPMPRTIRAAVTVVLAVLLLPACPEVHVPQQPFDLPLPLAIEGLIGVAAGLTAAVLVQGAALAGEIISVQMGLSMGPAIMVLPDLPGSEFGHLFGLFATVLYLGLDGHLMLLQGIADSLRALPPGAPLDLARGSEMAVSLFGALFATAVCVAGPVLATLLLTHVSLALLNRAVPQLNALMTSFPITIGAGMLMLGIALPVMTTAFAGGLSHLPEMVEHALDAWVPLTAAGTGF